LSISSNLALNGPVAADSSFLVKDRHVS